MVKIVLISLNALFQSSQLFEYEFSLIIHIPHVTLSLNFPQLWNLPLSPILKAIFPKKPNHLTQNSTRRTEFDGLPVTYLSRSFTIKLNNYTTQITQPTYSSLITVNFLFWPFGGSQSS